MNNILNKNIKNYGLLLMVVAIFILYNSILINIENIGIVISSIAIGSLVNKHDKKVTFKNSGDRKYEFKNVAYSFTVLNFKEYLIKFVSESGLIKNHKIGIITQFRTVENGVYTVGGRYPLMITESSLENSQLDNYADLLSTKFELLDNWYKDVNISEIIFNYTLITDNDYERMTSKSQRNSTNILKENQFLNKEQLFGLPLNMIYKGWGNSFQIIDGSTFRVNDINNSNENKYIEVTEVNNNNYIIKIFVNGTLLETITDRKTASNEFIRYTETRIYYVKESQIFFHFDNTNKLKNISKLRSMKSLELNMMTLDIKTNTINIHFLIFI